MVKTVNSAAQLLISDSRFAISTPTVLPGARAGRGPKFVNVSAVLLAQLCKVKF